jgi:Ca-activated chloride channel homolog
MLKYKAKYNFIGVLISILITEILLAVIFIIFYLFLYKTIPGLKLDRPSLLWILAGGPVISIFFLLLITNKNSLLKKFADVALLPYLVPGISTIRAVAKFLAFRIAFTFLVITLVNPMLGSKTAEAKIEGIDLMIALDISNSMLAQDLEPNRLERAKRAIQQALEDLKGNRIGIVVFGGESFVQLPITTDYSAAKLFLGTITTDIMPVQGTAIGSAIDLSLESFDYENGTQKAIIVITDGENHEDDAIRAATDAAEKNVIVHTIGMGSVKGSPLPLYQNGNMAGYRKDKEGNTIISKLDEKNCADIALAGKGIFLRATNSQLNLNALFEEINGMKKTEFGTVAYADYEDRFQLFLIIALFFLCIDLFITERKNNWLEKFNIFK